MGNLNQAYEEVAVFLASLDPHKLLELKPSKDVLERVEELMLKNKEAELNIEEHYELDRYLALEHLIALAKAQAKIQLQAA
ncbi:MAG: hypothetical protein IT270_09770 [Saprospiraceae bacterium]|nr:hypothetical protein [Saprospiraceae bacterium]